MMIGVLWHFFCFTLLCIIAPILCCNNDKSEEKHFTAPSVGWLHNQHYESTLKHLWALTVPLPSLNQNLCGPVPLITFCRSCRRRRSSWSSTAVRWPAWWDGPRRWSSSGRAAQRAPWGAPRPSEPYATTNRSRYGGWAWPVSLLWPSASSTPSWKLLWGSARAALVKWRCSRFDLSRDVGLRNCWVEKPKNNDVERGQRSDCMEEIKGGFISYETLLLLPYNVLYCVLTSYI